MCFIFLHEIFAICSYNQTYTLYVSREWEFRQIIVVIVSNDNFYIQKSGHYDANKTTSILFSVKCLC